MTCSIGAAIPVAQAGPSRLCSTESYVGIYCRSGRPGLSTRSGAANRRAGDSATVRLIRAFARAHTVPVPLYQRIAEDLLQKIRSGAFGVGSVLPAEMLLMEHYGASRNTIRGALKQLQDMGLVSRRRNRGTVVENPPAMGAFTQSLSTLEDLVSLARTATRTIESSTEQVLDIATARELGCAAGSRWLHIAMTRREGGASSTSITPASSAWRRNTRTSCSAISSSRPTEDASSRSIKRSMPAPFQARWHSSWTWPTRRPA